jgi:hypothetical protein
MKHRVRKYLKNPGVDLCVLGKVKRKFTLEQATKAQRVSRGIALLQTNSIAVSMKVSTNFSRSE